MSVPGIGPSTALMVLSSNPVAGVRDAIVEGRVEVLEKIKGIGKKTAQRIVLELKGYLEQAFPPAGTAGAGTGAFNDAALALVKLGYARRSAEQAVQKAEARLQGNATVEQIIRESFKHI